MADSMHLFNSSMPCFHGGRLTTGVIGNSFKRNIFFILKPAQVIEGAVATQAKKIGR